MKEHVHVYIGVFNHKQRQINKNQLKLILLNHIQIYIIYKIHTQVNVHVCVSVSV